ncbi:hypothetical protein VPH35_110971 [Triticum aestivum]
MELPRFLALWAVGSDLFLSCAIGFSPCGKSRFHHAVLFSSKDWWAHLDYVLAGSTALMCARFCPICNSRAASSPCPIPRPAPFPSNFHSRGTLPPSARTLAIAIRHPRSSQPPPCSLPPPPSSHAGLPLPHLIHLVGSNARRSSAAATPWIRP